MAPDVMTSDHLDLEQPSSGLHHREAAAAVLRQDSNGNAGPGSGRPRTRTSPQHAPWAPHASKRRSSRLGTNGRAGIDVDDKYAKSRRRRIKRAKGLAGRALRLLRVDPQFAAICLASLILGLAWMHFAREGSAHGRRHPPRKAPGVTLERWRPRSGKKLRPDGKQRQRQQQQQSESERRRPSISLLIPRFDVRRYVRSWERNARDAALEQAGGQMHPNSIALEGWNFPAAFRPFPYARRTHGPIKNVDSDYGDLAYHSVRNEKFFGRVIPEDGEGGDDGVEITPLAFEPQNIEAEEDLKSRNRQRRKKAASNYPRLDSKGNKMLPEHASFDQLKLYYDDDAWNDVLSKDDGKTNDPRVCQKAAFSQLYFPTCNDFHDRSVGRVYDDPETLVHQRPENELYAQYLAHGAYRDVWILEDGPWIWPSRYRKEKDPTATKTYGVQDEGETFELVKKAYRSTALKTLLYKHDMTDEQFVEIQWEAIIMERLTRSPRIMDIRGHCSFSTMVEVVPIELEEALVPGTGFEDPGAVEKRNEAGLMPMNNFTAEEKLRFALQMAESLADLHGFEDGVIIHDDVQLCQWLRLPDDPGRIKLGDFNRATIMQWDAVGGGYCRFNNGQAYAQYRAPEEFAARNLDEKIDVFSFGNNIYAMLTGLWNFYDLDDDTVTQAKLINGTLAYVDPRYKERSFIEGKLVELMYRCWAYDPDERISIFGAVEFLRKVMEENTARGGR